MAGITQSMSTSFKVEILEAVHDFTASTGSTFKLALFAASSLTGTFDATTTNYTDMTDTSDETSGVNYTIGGNVLTNITPISTGTTAFTDFVDLEFADVTLTTSGCMIYNLDASGASVAVYTFGGDISATAGDLTIVFPTAAEGTAVIRIA